MEEEYNTLKERLENIRDERGQHRNTATRIGGAMLAMLDYLRDNVVGKFLSKVNNDTAAGQITFAQGLVSNVLAWFKGGIKIGSNANSTLGIDGNGNATLSSELLTAIGEVLKTQGYVSNLVEGGLIGNGFGVTKNADGRVTLQTDDLIVLGRMLVNSLHIREVTYIGGVYLLTPAGSTVAAVVPLYGEEEDPSDTRFWTTVSSNLQSPVLVGYRLYWLADNGTTSTMNFWQQGDQAYCQTFNISEAGEYDTASNSLWWRLVVGVGTDDGDPLDDGKDYHFADVADVSIVKLYDSNGDPIANATGAYSFAGKGGSYAFVQNGCNSYTTPVPGDKAVCLGSQTNSNRQGAIQLNTEGEASIGIYDGINNFANLSTHEVHFLSKSLVRMSSRRFQWTTATGESNPPTIYRGDWTEGCISYYYDEWDYNGSRWLCIFAGDNDRPEGLTCAPGTVPEGDTTHPATYYWKEISLKGEKGDSVLTGYCDYFHGVNWLGTPKPAASEASVGEVDLLDYPTDNDMIDVCEENGGQYSWEGYSVPLGSRYMMRGGDYAVYVATANGWVREGRNGADGASVSFDPEHSNLQYAVSQYGTAGSGRSYPSDISSWQNAMPAVQKGKYLWTKDTTAYNNGGTIVYDVSYGVTYWPLDGESVEIDTENTFVKYSTVKTAAQPADNTFTLSSPPELSQGDYLWVLSQVKYVGIDTPLKSYSVSRVGTDGEDGDDGSDGYTTHFAYAKLKSGQSIPANGKLTTAMVDQWARANFAGADAIGTYRDQTGTDSTDISSYTWTKWKGDKGEDGTSVMAQYAPNSSPSSSQIHDTWQAGDLYMRTKSSSASSWSSWHKIVGESGGETEYSFNISSALTTNMPSNPAVEPSPCLYLEWKDTPVATTSNFPYLWMRIVKKTWNASTQSYDSGTPAYVRITGKDGADGEDGDTIQTVTVYKQSDTPPDTPTGGTMANNVITPPSGWQNTTVFTQTSGVLEGRGKDFAFVAQRVYFRTTQANQQITVTLRASSEENFDYIICGAVDQDITSRPSLPSEPEDDEDGILDAYHATSGTDTNTFILTVPSAGTHHIDIVYTKDISTNSGSDCGWWTVSGAIIQSPLLPIWSSSAQFVNGVMTGSWSTPVRWNGNDGNDGIDGADAYTIVVNPAHAIFEETLDANNQTTVVTSGFSGLLQVFKGGRAVSFYLTSVSTSNCSNGGTASSPSTARYSVTVAFTNITSGASSGHLQFTVSTVDGKFTGKTAKVPFYVNRLATWQQEVIDGTEVSVATKMGFTDDGSQVSRLMQVGNYIRGWAENTAKLTETVNANSICNEKNLFGFSKGVGFGNAIPFVQGYGVVSNVGSSVRMALENFGFEGKSGYYVVTCEAKMLNGSRDITFSFWGKGSLYQTRTIGNDWTKLTMVFNLTGFYDGDNLNYRKISESGYFYTEGSSGNPLTDSNRLAIRYLQIERGDTPSLFGICPADGSNDYTKITDNFVLSDSNVAEKGSDSSIMLEDMEYFKNKQTGNAASNWYISGDSKYINICSADPLSVYVENGCVYTLSFWAKASQNGMSIQSFLYASSGQTPIIDYVAGAGYYDDEGGHEINGDGNTESYLTTSWRRFYIHWYVDKATGYRSLIAARLWGNKAENLSGYVYICGIRFDKGYVSSANRTEYRTVARQTARSIDFSVQVNSLEKAGIHLLTEAGGTPDNENEVVKGIIELNADNVRVSNDLEVKRVITTDRSDTDQAHVEVADGTIKFFGSSGMRNIEMGVDEQGCVVLNFFDNDGKFVYGLGPNSISVDAVKNQWTKFTDLSADWSTVKAFPQNINNLRSNIPLSTYWLFYEGYSKVGNAVTYNISNNSSPSSYDDKIYPNNNMSSGHPSSTPLADGGTGYYLTAERNYMAEPVPGTIYTVYFRDVVKIEDGKYTERARLYYRQELTSYVITDSLGNAKSVSTLNAIVDYAEGFGRT